MRGPEPPSKLVTFTGIEDKNGAYFVSTVGKTSLGYRVNLYVAVGDEAYELWYFTTEDILRAELAALDHASKIPEKQLPARFD